MIETSPTPTEQEHAAGPGLALVRYGELALKGRNRGQFEQTLVRNVRRALAPLTEVRVERLRGRLVVFPERRKEQALRRLAEVFGIKSVSPAWSSAPEPEAIAALAAACSRTPWRTSRPARGPRSACRAHGPTRTSR